MTDIDVFAHRPVHRGLPVPWVALWSEEVTFSGLEDMQRWKGILWQNVNRPRGEPDFGSTNSYRQRECMRRHRCQICGEKGADTWVIPDDEHTQAMAHRTLWKMGLVLNAPMHSRCYELAQEICPHLMTVPPLAVIRNVTEAVYVACSADNFVERRSQIVTLEEARGYGWVGRELIVRLVTS